jgi:hypothetical protein
VPWTACLRITRQAQSKLCCQTTVAQQLQSMTGTHHKLGTGADTKGLGGLVKPSAAQMLRPWTTTGRCVFFQPPSDLPGKCAYVQSCPPKAPSGQCQPSTQLCTWKHVRLVSVSGWCRSSLQGVCANHICMQQQHKQEGSQ